MPLYRYTAKTKDSKTIKDAEEASSSRELAAKLRLRNLFVVSIKEAGRREEKTSRASLFSFRRGKRRSVKLHDLTLLARSLSTTLSSGVTLTRSLDILSAQSESGTLDKILKECSRGIKEGLSLSKAIAKHPKVFSGLWQGIVEVGEVSGSLPFVLGRLADYLEIRMEFARKVKSALIYPAILTSAAVGAIFVFFKFLLPKFTELFKQFDITLPLPTQIIFAISRAIEENTLFIFGGVILLAAAVILVMRRPAARRAWDSVSLKLPVLGQFIFLTYIERFISTTYILLESGVPVVYALEIVARGVGNHFFEKNIFAIKEKVKEGASLSDEFRKINIFPLLVSEMTKIGEETGSMAEVFKKVSVHYQKELATRTERFVAAFEPLMIIFMGVIIGGIVISLFLPLFKIATLGG